MHNSPPRSNRSCCTSVRQRSIGSGSVGDAKHHADGAVRLIDRAVGLDAQALLGDARAVAETGAAVIAGAGINLAQAIAHDARSPREMRR